MKKKVENFQRTLKSLQDAIALPIKDPRDLAGVIKCFELTYETAWNALKTVLEEQGVPTTAPRDVFAKAYQHQIIHQEEIWLKLLKDRNLSVHVYDVEDARKLVARIASEYTNVFVDLEKSLAKF